jgi:hypothetical protein
MLRKALIAQFRSDVDDVEEPWLWTKDDVQFYLDDAINEGCERAKLIRDATTPEICEVTVIAGTSTYPLDSRILSVERAKLDSMQVPLEITSTVALDSNVSGIWPRGWRSRSSYGSWSTFGTSWERATGRPSALAIDRAGSGWTGRLVPNPTSDDVLRLQVYRTPLESLTDDKQCPEGIPERLHPRLLDWMKHLAYSKQDTETRNDDRAQRFAALFTSAFGERIDANIRRTQQDRHPPVVAFQEF